MASEDLLESVRHLPDQVRDAAVAAAEVEGLPDRGRVSEVVIIGRGVGGVAADVVEMVAEIHGSVPVLATGATVPSWVGESTLVLAVSQSGEDRATVEAARRARGAGAAVVAVTSGGMLLSASAEWGVPLARVDPKAGPAAGLAVVTVPVLVLLERLGLAEGMSRLISSAAEQLDARRLFVDSYPERIADIANDLEGRVAVVCGAGAIGKLAARRWVQELDQVAGVPSVRRKAPVDEDDLQTWSRLGRRSRGGIAAIVLRHGFEREGLIDGLHRVGDFAAAVHEVQAEGDGPLAQLLDLVLVGDAVAGVVAASASGTG